MEILGALIAGTFIGSVLGFVGAGGAMLAVPILIYGFGFEPSVASTAALAVVGAAALSGASAKIKTKQIYYRDATVIWAIGLVANIGFSSLVHRLSEDFIAIGFSLVIIFAGLSMLGSPLTTIHKRMSWPVLIGISTYRLHHWPLWNRWRLPCYPCACIGIWHLACNCCRDCAISYCYELSYRAAWSQRFME